MQITKRLLCAGAMAVTFSLVAARAGAQNDADGNSAASGHGRGATIEVCDKTAAGVLARAYFFSKSKMSSRFGRCIFCSKYSSQTAAQGRP
jgi:hypothetical protein